MCDLSLYHKIGHKDALSIIPQLSTAPSAPPPAPAARPARGAKIVPCGAADAALQNAWNQEKWRVAGIYASVCSLARLFELRKCAAIRGGHFFYCVWLAQPELGMFQQLCAEVGELNTATDQVLSLRRWKQENPGA